MYIQVRYRDRRRFQLVGLRLQTAGDIHAARLAAGRWGAELAGGCDRWVDLSALTDADAAKRILGERVDVLVDLNGQSKGGRPGILLRFPAPVRLSFLGFPASVGGAADYTGADARAAPPEYQAHFAERLLLLHIHWRSWHSRARHPGPWRSRRPGR